MKRLAKLEKHEVRDVHHVIYRATSDSCQPFLQPLRRRTHFYALDGEAHIARSAFCILDVYANRCRSICLSCLERLAHLRTGQFARNAVQFHIGVNVAGHAIVRSCVHAIGRNLVLNDGLGLDMKIILSRHTHGGVFRKDLDAFVALAYSQLVLCADHPEALHSANLRFLNLKVTREDSAHLSKQNLLSCSYIRCATHYL